MRIEGIGRLGIFFSAERTVLQIPFSLCKSGIDAPMNEDAESIFGKLATTLYIFRGGLIIFSPQGGTCHAQQGDKEKKAFHV